MSDQRLAAMEEQMEVITGTLRTILDGVAGLKQLLPRLERLEQAGLGKDQVSPSESNASTHVMIDSEGGSAEPRPPSGQRRFDQESSPLKGRTLLETQMIVLKDPGIKLLAPVLECKDPLKIRAKEFIVYFDDCESFISNWEAQPGNSGKKFDGETTFGPRNLKVPQQRQLAKMIQVIYHQSELRFVKKSELGNQIWWLSVTQAMAKSRLYAKMAKETSLQACVRDLQRIKFVSPFGLIDTEAWDDYKKKLQDQLSLQSENGFDVPDSVVKDLIIVSLPDVMFQKDLVLLFGPLGYMYGHQELSDLIASIEARIQSVLGQNLQAVVNRAVASRDATSGKFNSGKFKANVAEFDEFYGIPSDTEQVVEVEIDDVEEEQMFDDDQSQLQAFLADTAGKKTCDRTGTAPDGKLKCRFLGGPKASCVFSHPAADMLLKGKGFSIQGSNASSARGGQSRDA